MPFFLERLIQAVLVLAGAIFLGSLALIGIAIGRRVKREASFKVLDAFRDKSKAILDSLLSGMLEYPVAVEHFQQMMRSRRALAVEQVFLELLGNSRYEGILRRAAEDIGLIEAWQRRLEESGGSRQGKGKRRAKSASLRKLRFVTRARNAENLGRVHHRESWPLLVDALHDPHPDVQAVALRSLGAITEPKSFPALVEQLRAAVVSATPNLSERALKAALAQFPPEFGIQLLPLLEDAHPRVRVVAAQILKDMLATPRGGRRGIRERLEPEIAGTIVRKLAGDADPDVRAVAAGLLSFFEAASLQATQCLLRLCDDPMWFVRLHAVCALGERRNAAFSPQLCARAADSHWRVREAALHSLMLCGREGLESILDLFLNTRDAYTREQIAEELQVSGAVLDLMAHLGQPGYGKETETVMQIVGMGKNRYLQWVAPERWDGDRMIFSTLTPG